MITVILGCTKEDCDREKFSYIFKIAELRIDTIGNLNYSVSEGSNMVFEYHHIGAQCADVNDDESGELILFQISGGPQAFSLKDDELTTVNCLFREYGAWVNRTIQIESGDLTGEKINDNEWHVEAEFTIDSGSIDKIQFNEVFMLEPK